MPAPRRTKVKPQNLIPYDILCGIVAKPSNSEIVLLFVAPRAFRIGERRRLLPGGGHRRDRLIGVLDRPRHAVPDCDRRRFGDHGDVLLGEDFAAGDVLKVVAPGATDATLADIAITLAATLL